MRIYILLLTLILVGGVLTARAETPSKSTQSGGSISLRQAVALALTKHPALAVYSKDIRIADARSFRRG